MNFANTAGVVQYAFRQSSLARVDVCGDTDIALETETSVVFLGKLVGWILFESRLVGGFGGLDGSSNSSRPTGERTKTEGGRPGEGGGPPTDVKEVGSPHLRRLARRHGRRAGGCERRRRASGRRRRQVQVCAKEWEEALDRVRQSLTRPDHEEHLKAYHISDQHSARRVGCSGGPDGVLRARTQISAFTMMFK